jgi:cell division protein DivIC
LPRLRKAEAVPQGESERVKLDLHEADIGRKGGTKRVEERKDGWMPNLFTVIVVLWLLGFGYKFYVQQSHLDEVADDRAVAVTRLEEARARNAELKKERDSMDKPEFIEKVAREELGMTRQEEMPYIPGKK